MRKPGPRMNDPYLLRRFVDAQQPVYGRVLAELRQGRKQSHWMWFIFPQIKGLGHSAVATKFAISSREEAKAIWNIRSWESGYANARSL